MTLIKAYHSTRMESYKRILETGSIKILGCSKELREQYLTLSYGKSKLRIDQFFNYFAPIQPFISNSWGNCGFVFDAEVLIQEYNACLCHDTLYVAMATTKEQIREMYLERAQTYKTYFDIIIPRLGPLYGQEALDLLEQIQQRLDKYKKLGPSGLGEKEYEMLLGLEIRCSVDVPISKAYSKYQKVPYQTWYFSETHTSSDLVHQSQWETKGYEIRLN